MATLSDPRSPAIAPLGRPASNPRNTASKKQPGFDLLRPLRRRLDRIQITSHRFAHFLCRAIPGSCPFERDISLLKYTLHIPALCKLNPLYNELVALRFRALTYLADVWDEDITPYIY